MANNTHEKHYVFYRISCLNKNITDCYIGSTTDITKRRYVHKCMCVNPKYNHMLKKLYETINLHGGWSNWTLNVIDRKICNKMAALIHETKLMDEYNSTLNKNRAFITKEEALESQKKWNDIHKEQIKKRSKEWHEKHPDYMKNWREKNRERMREHAKNYYQKKKAKNMENEINPQTSAVHSSDSSLVQDALTHSCETHLPCELDQLPQPQSLELPHGPV